MNWLTDLVRPRLKALMGQKSEMPEDLWHKCPACEKLIFHRDLEVNLHVCHHCDHHIRLSARDRMRFLFDDGASKDISVRDAPHDPLKFRDLKRYSDRLKAAKANTGSQDAVCVAEGSINSQRVVASVFDFNFMGGSMGVAAGEALITGAERAVAEKLPYIVVTASGGARMQEGILALMQMPRATIGVSMVKDAGLPYITVLTDPTTGGVSASFAMLGDVILAEPKALIAFTGARVIKQTIRAELPEGFQRSEYLLEHGMVDRVVHRKDLRQELTKIFKVLIN